MKTFLLIPPEKLSNVSIEIPGSKSYTNRALLMAAFTLHPVSILRPLESDDTRAMLSCLRALGIECRESSDRIDVIGDIRSVEDREYELDADISGTTIRFILALTCIVPGTKILRGKPGLNARPIKDLVDGLRQLGATIEYLEKEGFSPLKISSSKLTPGTLTMSGATSSQFISSILMIAPIVGGVTLKIDGEQISKPYIAMTLDTMREFGVNVENKDYAEYVVPAGQAYTIAAYTVEGDISSASYFFAIAALTESTITVINVNPQSAQADMGFLNILERMGNEVVREKDSITVHGKGVRAMTVDMEHCPDQAQTLAVLAAFAPGETVISGIR